VFSEKFSYKKGGISHWIFDGVIFDVFWQGGTGAHGVSRATAFTFWGDS